MTTQDKINCIIKTRYDNYNTLHGKKLKPLHDMIRNVTLPYTKKQVILSFFGVRLPERKVVNNDEAFLKFLEKQEAINPKPVFRFSYDL